MKNKTKWFPTLSLAVVAVLAMLNAQPSTAQAQGSAFNYQGRLSANGSPVSGSYDFRFKLYDDPYGNTQVGATQFTNAVPVSAGLFLTTLDFGAGLFTGSNCWLEVDVRTNGAGGYTVLSPMQAVMPTPYAIMANSASNLLGTLPLARLGAGTASISISGNAATAATATSFSSSLAGDVTGTQSATVVSTVSGQTAASVAAGASAANNATSANTASRIVQRDGSGNFAAGMITASLNGNAATATSATSATTATTANNFSGSLAGDVTGTQSATTVAAVGGQTAGNIAAGANAANNATSANTASRIVQRDNSGSFAAGTATLAGNLNLPTTSASAGFITSGGSLLLHAYGSGDIFVGANAGNLAMVGGYNTGIGAGALQQDQGGFWNTASGYAALADNTSGSANTASGFGALVSNNSGTENTANGVKALYFNTSAWDNTANGAYSLSANTIGSNNVANGAYALKSNTYGNNNTANGVYALNANVNGNNNTANGYSALYYNINGNNNTANGYNALYWNGNGSFNTAEGRETLALNNNGSNNIALGYQAGYNIFNNNNIDIGNVGNSSDNSIIRIGTPGTHTTTYLTGNVGIDAASPAHKLVVQADDGGPYYDAQQIIIQGNTNNSQQLELGYKTSGNYGSIQAVHQNVGFKPLVLQPSGGNVGIGTTSPGYPLTMNSGAYCSSAGVWTSVSDRNAKEDFTVIAPAEVLAKVVALPITQWKYKVEPAGLKHIGPVAQDFHAAFGLGDSDRAIGTIDESGVALAAIQGLNEKLNAKDAEIQELKQSVAELTALVEKLAGK